MTDIVILDGCRTAIGTFGGKLAGTPPTQLGATVAKEAMARSGVEGGQIRHVVYGHVINTEPRDMYVSRVAAMDAGIPDTAPAMNVNRLCGSGAQAIVSVVQSLMLGDADFGLAGGVETMSRSPFIIPDQRWGAKKHPKPTTAEGLDGLRPAFQKDGTVTAGNASGINDGAAAMVLARAEAAEAAGLKPRARILGYAHAGVRPEVMGIGPIPAVQALLEKTGLSVADFDVVESNEAFAAQALAVNKGLGLDAGRVNPNGGAIALGHPVGATGAILTVKALYELERTGRKRALITMCIGGGQGIAIAIEAL